MSYSTRLEQKARERKEAFVDEGPIRFWLAMGVELTFSSDLITISTRIDSPYLNGVLNCRLHPRHIPGGIEMMKKRFDREGVPFFWRVKDEAGCLHLQEALLSQGFVKETTLLGLHAELNSTPESLLEGKNPLTLRFPSDLRGISDVLASRMALTKRGKRDLLFMQGAVKNFSVRHFLGSQEGEIVAAASILYEGDRASIHHLSLGQKEKDAALATRFVAALALHCKRMGIRSLAITHDERESLPFLSLGFERLSDYGFFLLAD
ncbi:hypothetical protein [Estrella lausannensis]|uniref:N-acetyltransferase domain-containing protein n=1 Tax=Estrella lausannensis TaxID=483423 RepID=A0A0H5DR56_9BACT|nr:hypothetical protein [Estrella lausannensis]CRX38119.1 hypothetical protein ELAC_0767 [Estrella lausannensis]